MVYGPGAKWKWRPVPVKNPGPGGRRSTKEYYWKCDVNLRGKGLRQTKISFGQLSNKEEGGDNKGLVENILTDTTKRD